MADEPRTLSAVAAAEEGAAFAANAAASDSHAPCLSVGKVRAVIADVRAAAAAWQRDISEIVVNGGKIGVEIGGEIGGRGDSS